MTLGYSRKLAHFTRFIMRVWFNSNISGKKRNVKRERRIAWFILKAYMLHICASQLLSLWLRHCQSETSETESVGMWAARRWHLCTFNGANSPHDIQPVINKLISLELPCSTSESKFRVRLQKFKSDDKHCIPFVLAIFAFFSLLRHRSDERIVSFSFLDLFLSSDAETSTSSVSSSQFAVLSFSSPLLNFASYFHPREFRSAVILLETIRGDTSCTQRMLRHFFFLFLSAHSLL